MAEVFKITRQWLHAHSTPGGGWTARQLAVFDVPWPPQKGWLSSLIGLECSLEQKAEFERLYGERQDFRQANGLTAETRRLRRQEQQERIKAAASSIQISVTINGAKVK